MIPRRSDPENDKRLVLRYASHTVNRPDAPATSIWAAIQFAASCGASLKELVAATGFSEPEVKRIVELSPAS